MKKYIVKTGTAVNQHRLHACDLLQFETADLAEAREVFVKEAAQLAAEYVNQRDLGYSPTDYEQSHAVFCELISLVVDEDGSVEDIESLEISDYFYEK